MSIRFRSERENVRIPEKARAASRLPLTSALVALGALSLVASGAQALPRTNKYKDTTESMKTTPKPGFQNLIEKLQQARLQRQEFEKKAMGILCDPKVAIGEKRGIILKLGSVDWRSKGLGSASREEALKSLLGLLGEKDSSVRYATAMALRAFDWSGISKASVDGAVNIFLGRLKQGIVDSGDLIVSLRGIGAPALPLLLREFKAADMETEYGDTLTHVLSLFRWTEFPSKENIEVLDRLLAHAKSKQSQYSSKSFHGIRVWSNLGSLSNLLSSLDWSKIPERIAKETAQVLTPIIMVYGRRSIFSNSFKENAIRESFAGVLLKIGEPAAGPIVQWLKSRELYVSYPMLQALSEADIAKTGLSRASSRRIRRAVARFTRFKRPKEKVLKLSGSTVVIKPPEISDKEVEEIRARARRTLQMLKRR